MVIGKFDALVKMVKRVEDIVVKQRKAKQFEVLKYLSVLIGLLAVM